MYAKVATVRARPKLRRGGDKHVGVEGPAHKNGGSVPQHASMTEQSVCAVVRG